MKKILKHIIAAMLTLAIALTGISFGDTTTAYAATPDKFVNGETITLKPGDVKKLPVVNTYGNDITSKFKWSSSDKNVVTVTTEFIDETIDYTECIEITAVASGTATIIGELKGTNVRYTMTANVTMPKVTAAQKNCKKHTWKVTKEATCARGGIKTCSKCRLQKTTKKVAHKYVNTKIVGTVWDSYYWYAVCSQCATDPSITNPNDVFEVPVKCIGEPPVHMNDKIYVAPDSECNSPTEAVRAVIAHHAATGMKHYSWTDRVEMISGHEANTTIKTCKWCGIEKK